jgi:hypothetical protein
MATWDPATKRIPKAKPADIFLSQTMINFPPNNSAIMTNTTIINAFMSSVAKAEQGGLFSTAKEAVYLCQIITKMGHWQP